jgi:hypothetical protein
VIDSGHGIPREHRDDAEFFLIAEAGVLEVQALLLCRSIRRFGCRYSSAAITVVSPRASRRPSRATLRELNVLGAEYLALDIHSPCPAYGPSFKVLVAAHIARRPGPPIVVQLDSDTLFLGEPNFSLTGVDAAARPVDVKGMCTSGWSSPGTRAWFTRSTPAGSTTTVSGRVSVQIIRAGAAMPLSRTTWATPGLCCRRP